MINDQRRSEEIAKDVDRIVAVAVITARETAAALDREIENRVNQKMVEQCLNPKSPHYRIH